MTNLFHIGAMILGLLAYVFSDVNSASGFTNTFLPFIVLICFIYGLIVTINIFYNLRKNSHVQDKSADLLFESMKEIKNKPQAQQNSEPSATRQQKVESQEFKSE